MRPDSLILTVTATLLDTTARVLKVVADATAAIASGLEPASHSDAGGSRSPPASQQRPDSPRPARGPQPQPAERRVTPDVDQLVKRTAPEVIAALDDLSDVELGDLYEREANGRRRTSVLRAIEEASAPPEQPAEPPAPAGVDQRDEDELVHTSETPA